MFKLIRGISCPLYHIHSILAQIFVQNTLIITISIKSDFSPGNLAERNSRTIRPCHGARRRHEKAARSEERRGERRANTTARKNFSPEIQLGGRSFQDIEKLQPTPPAFPQGWLIALRFDDENAYVHVPVKGPAACRRTTPPSTFRWRLQPHQRAPFSECSEKAVSLRVTSLILAQH